MDLAATELVSAQHFSAVTPIASSRRELAGDSVTDPLRVLSLDEPWATLLLLAGPTGAQVKQWETRDHPPAGAMRPKGVRGIPGHAIAPGSRLAIHATDRAPAIQGDLGDYRVGGDLLYQHGQDRPVARLMRRRIIGTVRVTHAAKIVTADREDEALEARPPGGVIVNAGHRLTWLAPSSGGFVPIDISDQFDYGNWTPGRWGIHTRNPRRTTRECPWCAGTGLARDPLSEFVDCPICLGARGCSPIVTPGGQGVWTWPKRGAQPERSTRVTARVFLSSRAADEDTVDDESHPGTEPVDYPTESVTGR